MKLLLTAATYFEIEPALSHLNASWKKEEKGTFHRNDWSLTVCLHGIGMMSTTYELTKLFQKEKFDFAIQAGIGGSYNRNFQLGEVVMITEEHLGDLGSEDGNHFFDVFELNLVNQNQFPFKNGKLTTPFSVFNENISLKKASGLTVNSVTGNEQTANLRSEKFHCDIESMEGAAFHFVCLQEQIPFIQLRSISNYVEARDKSKWKMKEAVASLNTELIQLLENLSTHNF